MLCAANLCEQGRKPCPSPLTCSGAEKLADETIAMFRLHRLQQVEPTTVYLAPGVIDKGDPAATFTPPEEASLLVSYGIPFIAIVLLFGAAGFFGRAVGWF